MATKICLVYLLDITYDGVRSAKNYLLNFTKDQRYEYDHQFAATFLFLTIALCWDLHDIGTISEPAIDGLLIRLLDPKGVDYEQWLHCKNIRLIELLEGIKYSSWRTVPSAEPIVTFADASRQHLEETATATLISKPDLVMSGNLVEIDPDNGYRDDYIITAAEMALDLLDVAFFFSIGIAAVNSFLLGKLCVLQNFTLDTKTVHTLINRGADPNPKGQKITPLEATTLSEDYPILELLPYARADLIAVGDEGVNVRAIERRSTTEQDPFISDVDVDRKIGDMKEGYLSQDKIHAHNGLRNYETTLRIVETRLRYVHGRKRDKLLAMKNILKKEGWKVIQSKPRGEFVGLDYC